MKNLLKNPAFCVVPWIEDFYHLDGKKYLCCYSRVPVDNRQEILEKIWQGEKVDHCRTCYEKDENNVVSPRIDETIKWLKNAEIRNFFNTESTPEFNPVFYDLRYDNKCNLACVSCNPFDSSLWQKELKIVLPKKDPLNLSLDLHKTKKIYLAGGEPFLIKDYIDLIKKVSIINPDIELVINTNLTYIPDEIIGYLKKIKDVLLVVSIDSTGKVNEYHRYPMSWNKLMENLNIVSSNDFKIMFNTVVDAVSIWGFDSFVELESFPAFWNLSNLIGAKSLTIENLPSSLKQHAYNKIEHLKDIRFYKTDIIFKKNVDFLLENKVLNHGSHDSLRHFINELDSRRNINHTDYLGVNLTNDH